MRHSRPYRCVKGTWDERSELFGVASVEMIPEVPGPAFWKAVAG